MENELASDQRRVTEAMGTPEIHLGFELIRLKGSLEQARASVDAVLPVLMYTHQLAQRSQETELIEELSEVITALQRIQTSLDQAASKPLEEKGDSP